MFASPHRILAWTLCATLLISGCVAEEPTEASAPVAETQQRRQLFDIWDIFMFLHGGPACDGPGPIHPPHCKDQNESTGTTSTDSTTTTSASTSYSSYEQSSGSYTGADAVYNDGETAGSAGTKNVTAGFAWWMIVAAASVIAAMFAVNMGQRKNPSRATQKHGLQGAINRRVGAVSAFAEGALGSGGAAVADDREGVELKPGYHMESGPDGIEMHPGYELA